MRWPSNPVILRPAKLTPSTSRPFTASLVGDFPSAISAYTELLGKVGEAEVSQVRVDLGRARERNDEIDRALDEYRKAAHQDPQNAAAHLRAAILLAVAPGI